MVDARADLLVVGAGLGGLAGAVTACRLGRRVVLSEPHGWLGGQLTTQAVPPDEHPWIETSSASPSYARLRGLIRDHYRRSFPLTGAARADPLLNPGRGNVSRLCHEPRIAAVVLEELVSAELSSGRLVLLREHEPVGCERVGSVVRSVTLRHRRSGAETTVRAPLVIDASELGDVLELAAIDHVIGTESRAETEELHAPAVADPLDQQAISWCCALEWAPGHTDNLVDQPERYEHFATRVAPFWPGPQLSYDDVDPETLALRHRPLFASDPATAAENDDRDLWHFRRIRTHRNLCPGTAGGEITLVNWPQIDYWERPLLGVSADQRAAAEVGARELTLSLVRWLQTEAPRWDGGSGYPELRLRGDVTGTADGLAMAPYIRESRRIRAQVAITEADIGREMRGAGNGAAEFADAVGIGYYRIDLHPSTGGRGYVDIDCFPFQIPLGSLLPRDVDNVIAGNKNIGTTHLSNGAYRLHPVEWSIGEAGGALAAFCADEDCSPLDVATQEIRLRRFQRLLTETLGISLRWPDEIRLGALASDSGVVPP